MIARNAKDDPSVIAESLRLRAEAAFKADPSRLSQNSATLTPDVIRSMFHELQVHQIELEMQNEELRRAHLELDASRARYFDLYDMAPVGYLTIDGQGLIQEANLTAANMLGIARGVLDNQPVSRCVFKDDQDIYYLHRKQLLADRAPQECELRMVKSDGTQFWAHLKSTVSGCADDAHVIRLAFSDVSPRKLLEQTHELDVEKLRESEAFNSSVLDSLDEHIAVLDRLGVVVAVNKAWRQFAEKNSSASLVKNSIGLNYLDICAAAKDRPHCQQAAAVAAGISSVLEGNAANFNIEYPCNAAGHVDRWYYMNVSRLQGSKFGAVIRHEEITARKQAEAALRLAKDFSQSILDGLPYLICVLDMTGTIVSVNQSWKTYAIKSGTLLERVSVGRDYLAICDTALGRESLPAARFAAGIREVLSGELESYRQEYPSAGLKGSLKRILIGKVSRFSGKEKDYLIISQEDVTELRKAETALSAIEKRLSLAMECTNDGIWDWDVETGKVERNKSYFTILGYLPDELDSGYDTWKTLVHPEDLERTENLVRASHEGHSDFYEAEFRMRRKDGSWCWVLSRGRVVQKDKQGKPLRMIGTHTDITDRKRTESILQESELRMRSVLNTIAEGVVLIDSEGVIHLFNTAAQRLFGYAEQEILGQRIEVLMPSPYKENHANYVRRFVVTGEPQIIGKGRELIAKKKDGSAFPIFLNVSELKLSGETYFMGVVRDLTELKRVENEREKLEKQFLQAQKMESLGVLAGGIAHDFNNILSSILGYTEIAKSNSADERVVRALDNAVGASLRARNLIKQVLIFSRSGGTQLKSTDLKTLMNEVLEQILPTVPKNVCLVPNVTLTPCWVTGDASQLHQLLLNLLTNACQAMPEGGSLHVGLAVENLEADNSLLHLESGSYAHLTVKDTGVGMSEAVQARIFDPFYSTKGTKGTGLGLSVVHGIIKSHHGAIRVESILGKGSTFTVWLPITKSKELSSATMPAVEFKITGSVLILDDDDMLLFMIAEMFQDMGFEVDRFSDPSKALEALTRNSLGYKLFVSDYSMPNMSGLDLIDRARQIAPDLPAIIMTGYGDTLVYERSRNDFFLLPKPFTVSELKSALSVVLAPK